MSIRSTSSFFRRSGLSRSHAWAYHFSCCAASGTLRVFPAIASLIKILHGLAREQIVVVEIAERELLEYVVVAVLGVFQVRFGPAMSDQNFPVLVMRLVGGNVPLVLR